MPVASTPTRCSVSSNITGFSVCANKQTDEHHYQNFKPGAKSPKANPFLEKHLRDIGKFTFVFPVCDF